MFLFEIFINFYQGFLIILFINKVLEQKHPAPKLIDIASVVCIGGFLCICQFVPTQISDVIIFVFPFLHACITHRGEWRQRILWTIICAAVMQIVVVFIRNSFSQHIGDDIIMLPTSARVGYVISTNIVLTIAFMVVSWIGRQQTAEFLNIPSFASLIGAFLLAFFATEFLYLFQTKDPSNEELLLYVYICLLGLVILTFLLYYIIVRAAHKQHVTEMQLQTMSLHADHQQEMSAIYHDMLMMQHDMKHQINTIKQILQSSSDVDKETVLALLHVDTPSGMLYMTGCTVVDAILTAKHAIMEQHNIHFNFQPYPLQKLPLEDTSFCILLSNILDNAIEGVQRIINPELPREIHLSFARSWSMFYLTCVNTINPKTIKKIEDRFITSKENKRIHGLGINSIRQIVTDNQGICNIVVDKQRFSINIVLPDKEEFYD